MIYLPIVWFIAENSTYNQQSTEGVAYQQYSMQSAAPNASNFVQSDAPKPIPLPNETSTTQTSNQSMFNPASDPSEDEHRGKFGNGMTFESSALKQQDKPSHDGM